MTESNLNKNVKALQGKFNDKSHFYPFISYLKFFNYKRIFSGEFIEFSFPVTALVGRNGTNKSSILHALLGCPAGESPGKFWFSTKLDPIREMEERPRFYYRYEIPETGEVAEVRKMMFPNRKLSRGKSKKADPDYWEPTQPAIKDGMIKFKRLKDKFSSTDRWNAIAKNSMLFDLRTDLTIFDKIYYSAVDSNRVTAKKKIRRSAAAMKIAIEKRLNSSLWHNKERIISNEIFDEDSLTDVNDILGKRYSSISYIEH